MNFFRISYLILSITIIIFTTSISAQSDSTNQQTSPLHAGSWSLQFRYNNSLRFDSFKGGNISAKYHFTDKSALRFGINLSSQYLNKFRNNNDEPIVSSRKNERSNRTSIYIGLTTDYVYYISTSKDVNLFVSSGTTFGLGYSDNDITNSFGVPDTTISKINNKSNIWSLGADFSLGVEWVITSKFSIHGEYQTNITYRYIKRDETTNNLFPDSQTYYSYSVLKSFVFSPANVLIGVSLYF